MTRCLATTLACVVALTAHPASTETQDQVFRSGTEAVIVSVSVLDGVRPVTGLTEGDFELRDDGVVQSLADFTTEPLPIDVTFLLELGATRSQRDRVQAAFQKIAGSLRPIDRCRLLSALNPSVTGSVLGPSADGVYGVMALALVTPLAPGRRQLGLLITDGREDLGFIDAAVVVDAARYSDLVMDVILAEDPLLQGEARVSSVKRTAGTVASTTGGQLMVRDSQKDDLGQAALDAMEAFQSSYVLAFTPRDRPREGWHELSVKIPKAGAGRYAVSARKGYVERGVGRQ